MKKCLLIILTLFVLFLEADAQVFRPMAIRYNNASVKGNIVYVANNSVTTPAAITTEAPPGGTAVNNGNPGAYLDIDVDAPAHTMKIPYNSVWSYHSNGAAPANNPAPTDWKQPAYIMPAAWNVGAIPVNGPGKYGYANPGDLSIATCIKSSAAATACVPAAGAKYTAYYFRKTVNFTGPELAAYSTLFVNLKRNDGIVVYVNGVERLRTNMPGGVIAYGTLATNAIATGAAENYTFNLNPSFFVAGVNTIAVETHLSAITGHEVDGYVGGGQVSAIVGQHHVRLRARHTRIQQQAISTKRAEGAPRTCREQCARAEEGSSGNVVEIGHGTVGG